jgi:hypothetical protein
MSRILADLTPRQIEDLDQLATTQGVSRAALISDAVDALIQIKHEERSRLAPDVFGMWKDRAVDGLAYEQEVRRQW